MKTHVKTRDLDLTPSLLDYCEEKMAALEKFLHHFIENGGEIELDVELARTTEHHHKGDVFEASVHVRVPGAVFRASDTRDDIRVAIDGVKHKLHEELERDKEFRLHERRTK